jgi:hypothetical protein
MSLTNAIAGARSLHPAQFVENIELELNERLSTALMEMRKQVIQDMLEGKLWDATKTGMKRGAVGGAAVGGAAGAVAGGAVGGAAQHMVTGRSSTTKGAIGGTAVGGAAGAASHGIKKIVSAIKRKKPAQN